MSISFFQELSTTYNINLSEQQKTAVTHGDGPCLLLAVPGGGKTTTLLSRVAYLIKEAKVRPEQILSITFSRASATDMKARYQKLFMDTIPGKVSFSTIHSFSYGVVMNYMKSVGRQVTLIEGTKDIKQSKGQILRQIYRQVNHDYISEGDFEILTNDLSYVKNLMLSADQIMSFSSEVSGFSDIYKTYEQYKKQHRLIDFDDMLVVCYKILKTQPQVKKYYQNRYRYVQVDEAQDTSRLQHAIIELLVEQHGNLFYVADDDQSIYGFRGADPGYLLNIKIPYPQAKVIRMEHNYRSTEAIVSASNTFIKQNVKRYDKAIYTDNDKGLPILIHEVLNRLNQYEEVVKRLGEIGDHCETAVIYRNNHTAVSMIHALSKTTIPFKLKGMRRRFFDHWVVTDILTLLHFAQSQDDLHAFKSFYYKLRGYYISKEMILNIEGRFKDMAVFEQLVRSNSLAPYQVTNIRNMREDFEKVATMTMDQAVEFILTQMGYLEFLMDRTGGPTATFESYNMMLEVLKDMGRGASSLIELKAAIEDMERRILAAADNEDPDALTLTTAHSAKGLEWTRVFMIDLIVGIFPKKDVMDSKNQDALEEERRLFYVAMTRAKKDLTLYRVTGSTPSVFLEELSGILNPGKKKVVKKPSPGFIQKPFAGFMTGNKPRTIQEPLSVGTEVIHKVYGNGKVKSCDTNKIVLVFSDGEKKLNYRFCMEQGLIQVKL